MMLDQHRVFTGDGGFYKSTREHLVVIGWLFPLFFFLVPASRTEIYISLGFIFGDKDEPKPSFG